MEKQQLSVDDDLLPIYYVHSDVRTKTFSSVWQEQEASASSPSLNSFPPVTENCLTPALTRTEKPMLNKYEHKTQDEAKMHGFASGTNIEVCFTKKDFSTVQKETASAFHQAHNATSIKTQLSMTSDSSSAQDVFLSSLLQVQLCVLDLQDQIDITETSHKARGMKLNVNPPSVCKPVINQSSIQEPQINSPSSQKVDLDRQKVDRDLERQELDEDQKSDDTAYSDLEIEDEGLFCNNPLFKNSNMDYSLQRNVHTTNDVLTMKHNPPPVENIDIQGSQLLKQNVWNSTDIGMRTAAWHQITREESLEELQIYEDEWEEKTAAFSTTRSSGKSAFNSLTSTHETPLCLEDPPAEKDSSPPDVPGTSPHQATPVEETGLLFSESNYWTQLLIEDGVSDHQDQPSNNQPSSPPAQEEPEEEIVLKLHQEESQHAVCQGCQGKEHGVPLVPPKRGDHEVQSVQQLDVPTIVLDQLDDVSTDLETSGSEEATYVEAVAGSQDVEAARCLAMKLFHLDGFDRSQVAPYLQKTNDFSAMVAEEYLALFDFTGKSLDAALRSLLQELVLTGETQERERVLYHFSKRFHTCNPKEFSSADAVHTLTCAIMLLNSDLHGQNIGKSMTAQDFISNLEGMNDGDNFPRDLLKALYHSIRTDKLEWAVSEDKLANVLVSRPESLLSVRKKSNPFMDIPSPDPHAPVYKQGVLCRKIHAVMDGKKTPWGKRGWKSFHTVLKGTLLFSFKGENKTEFQFPEEVISIHHALAERASGYTKKPNVFRLQTADWRVFLLQAQTSEEMHSWISRINLVAAMFSSPPFPSAVGSQKKFYRPILPSVPSKLDLEEQLQSHESLMDRFTDDLTEHQRNLPDAKSKSRDWEDYHLREEYLRYEKLRYETYVKLLAIRMESSCEDLQVFESRLIEPNVGEEENGGLKRSYSSPSLKPESSPLVKVKRNISERRTYRRIIPKRNKNLV